MYLIEIALKLSPLPLFVQRKQLKEATELYNSLKKSVQNKESKFLEIHCEQSEGKKIAFWLNEVLSVQIYEKTAGGGGSRRPGFSLDD